MGACRVCNEPLKERRTKKCLDCDPFWEKAQRVINNAERKEVAFHSDKEENKALFAQEMRKKWKEKEPYHLCPYTSLPMDLKNPVTKKEAVNAEKRGSNSLRETREARNFLVFSPDRIKSDKPYEPGNVEVCTYLGNTMKNALSKDDFDSVKRDMIKDKLTIEKDKELTKMILKWILDFYGKTDLTEGELEEHNNEIDEIKKLIDEKITK